MFGCYDGINTDEFCRDGGRYQDRLARKVIGGRIIEGWRDRERMREA
jgi:hypothetical protein